MNPIPPTQQTHPTGDRREELERIKAATWPADEPEEVRKERIRLAVQAIEALKPPPYNFGPEVWKYIAESPEVYDEE